MTRVLVCGGRDYTDAPAVDRALDALWRELWFSGRPVGVIIHGAAAGADALGKRWAIRRGVQHWPFPADWERHGRFAGPIRNGEMLRTKPDLVVAFPGGRGTEDMIRRARRAGVEVRECR